MGTNQPPSLDRPTAANQGTNQPRGPSSIHQKMGWSFARIGDRIGVTCAGGAEALGLTIARVTHVAGAVVRNRRRCIAWRLEGVSGQQFS